jgi:type IV fimbrial biogenesis protein FimT
MIVVVVIGVLAALAVPSIARQMRDRRTNQAAHEIALIYRQGRSLAMGRGAAVLVRYSKTAGQIELREANATDSNCRQLPATSCALTTWDSASLDNRLVRSFDFVDAPYNNVALKFTTAGGTVGDAVDICFTPLGRPFRRMAFSGAFTPMIDVPTIEVSPIDLNGLTRNVLIVPTGASRLAL